MVCPSSVSLQTVTPEIEIDEISPDRNFSKSELELAWALIRRKPPHMSCVEYMLRVREAVKRGCHSGDLEDNPKDDTNMWKREFEKLLREKQALEDQVDQLNLTTSPLQLTTSLQKLYNENCYQFDNSLLHRKAPVLAPHDSTHMLDRNLRPQYVSCTPLLKDFVVLYQFLKDGNTPAPKVFFAVQICLQRIIELVERTCLAFQQQQHREANHYIHQNLYVAAAAFERCLHGLVHLGKTITGRNFRKLAIMNILSCFDGILEELKRACRTIGQFKVGSLQTHDKEKPQDTASRQDLRASDVLGISQLVVDILKSPILTDDKVLGSATENSFDEIFQGMMALFLKRLGITISLAVFKENLADSHQPSKVSSKQRMEDTSNIYAAATLEGQHLALILKLVLENPKLNRLFTSGGSHAGDSLAVDSLQEAKKQLQDTLFKAVLGEDGKRFVKALNVPSVENFCISADISPVSDGDFIEAAWMTIGGIGASE